MRSPKSREVRFSECGICGISSFRERRLSGPILQDRTRAASFSIFPLPFRGYISFMKPSSCVDLGAYSFDDFIAFMFNRDAPADSVDGDRWYYHVDVEFAPEIICSYYILLFQHPDFLATRFTKQQLEQGFWAILGPNLDCSLYNLIHYSNLHLSTKEDCIHSMTELFDHFFTQAGLDTVSSMWWDALCYDWHCGNRSRERGGEDEQLQNVFFRTLSALLSRQSETCQGAALHGLGHLHHPDTAKLIEEYIQEHPTLTKEWKAYALAASKFEIM
jgi:hypothetical protein